MTHPPSPMRAVPGAAGSPTFPQSGSSAFTAPLTRPLVVIEIVLLLSVSLGSSAAYAVVDFIAAATAPGGIAAHRAIMNGSLAPDRPWLDLVLQLLPLCFAVVPVALAAYLLIRSGADLRATWFGGGQQRLLAARDVVRGAAVAAGVGSLGVVFYLLTHTLGLDLTVVAAALADVWWAVPILVLSAAANAVLEEFVVLGFVLVRLRQLGLREPVAIAAAAVLRVVTTCTRVWAGSSAMPPWALSSAGSITAGDD